MALVRFDSFANLLVPKDVQADEIETLNNLLEYVQKGEFLDHRNDYLV